MNDIHKSKDNAVLFGVLGGLGEYFNVDPVLLRVIVVLLTFISGGFPLFLVYVILAFIMPDEPEEKVEKKRKQHYGDFFGGSFSSRRFEESNKRKEAEDVEVEDEDDWSDF